MATTGNVFQHEKLSGCDSGAGNVWASEQIGYANDSTTVGAPGGVAACTTYSIQAVAGIGTAGCMIAGLDYGRRQ